MIKRVISSVLTVAILICSLSAFSLSAEAVTYKQSLINKGFPESYANSLVELHNKFPKWEFIPFKTNLKWSNAVNGERSYHSKQLVQKQSSLNSGYYCNCKKCMKNGNYVIQEGSSWVSASENAVKYYMDPRNWLSEKYIFQFESTSYNSNQTISGIESIISSTWMKDAYITYKNADGKTITYKDSNGNKVKYSKAIWDSAKNSGMSAYYLASKIVQEVGGRTNSAGGASGTYSGYKGIYNYYNIGAYTGAADGLKWASVNSTTYKTNCVANLRKSPTTNSTKLATLSYNKEIDYISSTKKQSDGYVWYNIKAKVDGKTYNGYLRSDLVTKVTPTYNRPWTNPYKSIYNGATYISKSFSTYQNTGYLQKFNVNPASSSLYNHEYMANVEAAAAESRTTYNAYVKANILSSQKTFYIPVFTNMPSSKSVAPVAGAPSSNTNNNNETSANPDSTKVMGFKLVNLSSSSLSYSWSAVSKATKYCVCYKNVETGNQYYKYTASNKYTISNLRSGTKYSVKVKAYVNGSWKSYSTTLTSKTLPAKVNDVEVLSRTTQSVTLKWDKVKNADGYVIYKYANGKKVKVKAISDGTTVSTRITNLNAGTCYIFTVAAYVTNANRVGSESGKVSTRTRIAKVRNVTLTPTDTTIKVNWSTVSGAATGYYVSFARDKNFKDEIATRKVTGKSNTTYTGKNLTSGHTYYVKVRAYRDISNKRYVGTWSDTIKVTCK